MTPDRLKEIRVQMFDRDEFGPMAGRIAAELITEVERLQHELYVRDVERLERIRRHPWTVAWEQLEHDLPTVVHGPLETVDAIRPVSRCGSMSGLGEQCRDTYGHDLPHRDLEGRTWTRTPRYAE